ncbi:carbamoyltransferase HypF [Rhodobacteraceae bacterium CCMM004]|nr:carbamoyltransferase HypF [Rhodobacteraceae bacterium CCMM004]
MTGRRIRVRGQVQGVGFRPFVWTLAREHGVTGQVLNDAEGVLIEAWGPAVAVFEADIARRAPPLARVDAVEGAPLEGRAPADFTIAASGPAGAETRVTPDAATCAACAAEIRDPAERRHGYAFANCTHCGPRFTILEGLPYDRARTSMAAFAMCPACRAEYEDPADRRFHAQPIACPDCGPRVWLESPDGTVLPGDAVAGAAARLAAGEIVAVKGLGGFHLACDATDAAAVARLRARKRRPGKPFALMAPLDVLHRYARPDPEAVALLTDPAAPVVLVPWDGAGLPDGVAPGQGTLGWMLPYTPLHHLICDAVDRPLVMTSGNISGAPQAVDNAEARQMLGHVADAFVMHDRPIARRLDDSVERPGMVLRRARGRVPGTLPLHEGFADAPDVVAYGGQMKAAICLTKGGQALLGHHLGELDEALTWEAFLAADGDYAALFDHRPGAVAVDLHPDFRATRHGVARAATLGVPLVEVQHHHAHLASCLAENGWPLDAGPVTGIVLDGLGLGPDGTVWGGEVLVGDYRGYERAAWLAPAPLIGGDRAQAEPWRNLLVRLDAAGLGDLADALLPEAPLGVARQAAAAGVNAPPSSSTGRLFDAFAAALGICTMRQSYEGEAAMRLEALAGNAPEALAAPYPMAAERCILDPAPLFRAWADDRAAGRPVAEMAARFHAGVAAAVCDAAVAVAGEGPVALTGGCFQNALLLDLCLRRLEGRRVLVQRRVPANDGGLALGQAAVAAARLL